MYKHRYAVILFCFLTVFAVTASAQSITVDPTTEFCFSAKDFTDQQTDSGIFLTSLPQVSVATVHHGSRAMRAGDALPADALDAMTMTAHCNTAQEAVIGYYTVSNGVASGPKELRLSILPRKNDPPTAEDGTLETYRNIANFGTLMASDPENDPLIFTLVTQPKRGSVEIHEDGTYTYTPNKNKVGKDSFTFTVTDDAGNTSQPAKVTIEIKKPTDARTYADMDEDADIFSAMWLKEEGLFTGSMIGGNLCFEPDQTVTRGEFLVMAMGVVDATLEETAATTGFADEESTPGWLKPYVVSALADGMISGTRSEDGVRFLPQADLTRAEAAVMLQNILDLPTKDSTPVAALEDDTALPVWARDSVLALSAAGLSPEMTTGYEPMTRRDTAKLLYKVRCLMDTKDAPGFYWVQ